MALIVLDFGSGNTCKNEMTYVRRMVDELVAIDTRKHEVVIKWQLFEEAGENVPLYKSVFTYAHHYAGKLGYKTTASVFDLYSLKFLLEYFEPPFIKIANRRDLDWLIGEVPRKIPVYVSVGNMKGISGEEREVVEDDNNIQILMCISEYPATVEMYKKAFALSALTELGWGISDHTTDFTLWHKYQPDIIEWHYVLEHDPSNLDGGLFARTPAQLREVL